MLLANLLAPRILASNFSEGLVCCLAILILESVLWTIFIKLSKIRLILFCVLVNLVSGVLGIVFTFGFFSLNPAYLLINILFSCIGLVISLWIERDVASWSLLKKYPSYKSSIVKAIIIANVCSYLVIVIPYMTIISLYRPEPDQVVMFVTRPHWHVNDILHFQRDFYQKHKKFVPINNLTKDIPLRGFDRDSQYRYWQYKITVEPQKISIIVVPTREGYSYYGLPHFIYKMYPVQKQGKIQFMVKQCRTRQEVVNIESILDKCQESIT